MRLTSRFWRAGALFLLACSLIGPRAYAADIVLNAPSTPQQRLVIDGAIDPRLIEPVLKAFQSTHPHVAVHYRNRTTEALFTTYLADPERQQSADLVLSSAMAAQYLLANNGHAQSLGDAIDPNWPKEARWRNELVALSFEPIVMVLRTDLLPKGTPPVSHQSLLDYLNAHAATLDGKVVTYGPAISDTGFTFAVQDARQSPRYWSLVKALGQVHAHRTASTQAMLDGLSEGRFVLGYNLIGSYARLAARQDPRLRVVIPSDYALVVKRLAFIPRNAPSPDMARAFLRYVTSRPAQARIAADGLIGALHPALDQAGTAERLLRTHPHLRPIRLSPGLMTLIDPMKRDSVVSRWRSAFNAAPSTTVAPNGPPPP
ncbi:ABC transporter substrate-binding protein [Larsenimonas suaedae]|uniref:Extracellular solute-binding protein n=1 Tax=Larsenimonas suaedae TaxID=1851019 RepID=A0ABU1GXV0_9GAMM|nr:extracellular solute-binding protein [Larsenimonas suaedae]MCM2972781.1 extracellular solute-binding protein [Larsenimonas suaedae]MDR5896880.1 extracellular solute-binding protein [Larsenimonas suaedae]